MTKNTIAKRAAYQVPATECYATEVLSWCPPSMRRGLESGGFAFSFLALAVLPARLSAVLRHGTVFNRTLGPVAGAIIDLAAVALTLAPVLVVLTVLPTAIPAFRRRWWQHFGAPVMAIPLGVALYVLTTVAHEVKSERGAFPTVFDLAEGGGNASFVIGSLGFLKLTRVWAPLVMGSVLAVVLAVRLLRWARNADVHSWRGWASGLVVSAVIFTGGALATASGLAVLSNRASAAALGDPLTGIVESAIDMLRHQSAASPRELVLSMETTAVSAAEGAARLGWPTQPPSGLSCALQHARPLDFEKEPGADAIPGRALLSALQRASEALFANGDSRVAVFQLSLESFRADDVHALNPAAPAELDPFFNGLYEARGSRGVLTSARMFQAGVRTAQGLGALTCGVGTLPYNLSIIRDLQPLALRCTGDLWRDAGFRGSFFYGSDAKFDEMDRFLALHGYTHVVSQVELPATSPKGAWGGVTDFAVFDEAVRQVAAELAAPDAKPHFSLVMSLSNHSPYTRPEDLPAEVEARVDQVLRSNRSRALDDDRKRLLTHSYTDAAVERFFAALDSSRLAERSIVIASADHSTGETYVWGPDEIDPETDAAKARIPWVVVIPEAFIARVTDRPALEAALRDAQRELDALPLSQNDIPALMVALLSAHPAVKALPAEARWHTLGGQVTSPWFQPGPDKRALVIGVNGVSEFLAFDREGVRVGDSEASVFLKTRADRYRVTPTLIPVAATMAEVMRAAAPTCPSAPGQP